MIVNEEHTLAEALGTICAVHAQLRAVRDALCEAGCIALAAQIVPTLLVLEEIQYAIQAQLTAVLRTGQTP